MHQQLMAVLARETNVSHLCCSGERNPKTIPMSRKLLSMLLGVAVVALLAASATARTQHSGVRSAKAKIARNYVRQGPVAGTRFHVPANRGVSATNAFRRFDDIFVLDP